MNDLLSKASSICLLFLVGGCESHPDVTWRSNDAGVAIVVGTHPAAGASDVDPGTGIDVFFSKAIDSASLAATPPVVSGSSGEVVGTWSTVGPTLHFESALPLPFLDSVLVDVPALVDVDGQTTASHQFAFGTRDIEWLGQRTLSAVTPSGTKRFAMSPSGNASLTWVEAGSSRSAYRPAGGDWGAPLDMTQPEPVFDLALNDAGETFAVYAKADGVYARRSVAGSAWSAAVPLDIGVNPGDTPHVGVDAVGNAIAVWVQDDAGIIRVFASRYSSGIWSPTPTKLGSTTSEAVSTDSVPALAMSATGFAVVSWAQVVAADNRWAIRYAPGAGWGSAAQIGAGAGASELPGHAVIDDAGIPTIAWTRGNDVWVNRAPGGTWQTAEVLDTSTAPVDSFAATGSPSGWVLVTWEQFDGTFDRLLAARYVPATGWSPPLAVGSDAANANVEQTALDDSGRALAVWSIVGEPGLRASRLAGPLWGSSFDIEEDDFASSLAAGLGFAADGSATFTWVSGGVLSTRDAR